MSRCAEEKTPIRVKSSEIPPDFTEVANTRPTPRCRYAIPSGESSQMTRVTGNPKVNPQDVPNMTHAEVLFPS